MSLILWVPFKTLLVFAFITENAHTTIAFILIYAHTRVFKTGFMRIHTLPLYLI